MKHDKLYKIVREHQLGRSTKGETRKKIKAAKIEIDYEKAKDENKRTNCKVDNKVYWH